METWEVNLFVEILEEFVEAKIKDSFVNSDEQDSLNLSKKRDILINHIKEILKVEDND